jgi:hypothetical protein
MISELQPYHILSLQTFLAIDQTIFNLLTLNQRTVPLPTNGTVVDEHIATAFTLNEAIALGIVEPLHIPRFTCRHLNHCP